MIYNYHCARCEAKLVKAKGAELTASEADQVIFEVKHAMNPTAEVLAAIKCPRCKSTKVSKTMHGTNVTGYVAGAGLLDRAGCRREMAVHTLTRTDDEGKSLDPYGYMRENGEAEDLAKRIKNSKKPKVRVFDVGGDQPKAKKGKK